jgi:penicillin-binding protein 2
MYYLNKRNHDSGDPFVLKHGGFKRGKLEKYSHLREWIESSFVPGGHIGEVVGRTFEFSRLWLFAILIFIFGGLLMGRVAWLQIIKGDYYSSLSLDNSVRVQKIEAKRGIIYDRTGRPLVRNAANFVLYITPADLPKEEAKKNEILDTMSLIVYPDEQGKREGMLKELREKISLVAAGSPDSYQPIFAVDSLDYDKAMLFLLKAEELPGVVLSEKDRREYLTEGVLSLSHILGYTGKVSESDLEKYGKSYSLIDYIGKAGVENSWENELKGESGKEKIEVDALVREKKIVSLEPARDGNNLVLSVDYDLQKKAEEVLAANLKKSKLNKGAVVIMDPRNGEILSLVSLPAYDNRLFARGIKPEEYQALSEDKNQPLFDRAISGEYPSGSTVKPVIAAAALEEKIISEKTSVFSSGGLKVGVWFFPDWRAGGHGWTNVRKALADSVNTFFYYIGGGFKDFSGLGIERLVKYFRLFGLGTETGIDLPNEAAGFVPSSEWKEKVRGEKWYIGDTYHLSIGQGDLLVTPLQAARWTAFFANRGKIVKPHLVKEIRDKNNNLISSADTSPAAENIIGDYNVEVVRQGLRQTVTSGSAQRLKDLPVEAAAKTGTAQWGTDKIPHAWFTAFAPYKNPEIVVTVLVEEGVEGSQIGLTVAHNIMQYYFTRGKNHTATSTTFNLTK